MSACPNGHENPDNQHFCGTCGAPIPPVEPVPGAEWAADPTGRHEFRYWDGSAWSEHVADRGITSVDPPTGAEHAPAPSVGAVSAPPPMVGAQPSGSPVGEDTLAPVSEPRRSRKTWVVVLAAAVVVVLIAGAIALAVGGGSDNKETSQGTTDPAAANVAKCRKVREVFQAWLADDLAANEAQLTATQDWLHWQSGFTYLPSPDASSGFTDAVAKFDAEIASAQQKQQAANSNRDAYQIALPQCTVTSLPQACQGDFAQHQGLVDIANRHDAAVDTAVNAIRTQQQAIRNGDLDAANSAGHAYNAAASDHNTAESDYATASATHATAKAACDAALETT